MPAIVPAKLYELSRATDPRAALIDAVGAAIDQVSVMNNQLLVATYITPEVLSEVKRDDGTVAQLFKADTNKAEDLWMGCLGLVLKKGPMAFKDDARLNIYWDGQDAPLHSWVMFRYSSSWEQHLNGVSVRFVDDRDIKAVVKDPTIIVSKRSLTIA